jgi:hypothetical protein
VLVPVIKFLKDKAGEDWKDCIFDIQVKPFKIAENLTQLADPLRSELKDRLKTDERKDPGVSDILLSKILLATLCCVPAFDRYVIAALKDIFKKDNRKIGGDGFNKNTLIRTIELAQQNVALIKTGQFLLKNCSPYGIEYPLTKVFDLYLVYYPDTFTVLVPT